MKKIAHLLILIAVSTTITAQKVKRKGVQPLDVAKHKPVTKQPAAFAMEQLVGKWQEINRTDKSNNHVDFTDTIFLNFTNTKNVSTRQGNNMTTMSGAAAVETPGNILVAAADVYT